MRRFLLIIFSFFTVISLYATEFEVDGINFKISSDGSSAIVIHKHGGFYEGDLNIPESVSYDGKNYKVTGLDYRSLEECSSLKNIWLPSTVKSFGYYKSSGLVSLKNIYVDSANPYLKDVDGVLFSKDGTELIMFPYAKYATNYSIPDGVVNAYISCRFLNTISIPASTKELSGVSNCNNLQNIEVDSNNSWYESLDGILFSKDKKTIIKYPNAKSGSTYSVPDYVTNIGEDAFYGNQYLSKITLPNNIDTIGISSFNDMKNITPSVFNIASSVKKIWGSPFSGSYFTGITVSSENPKYKSIDGVLYTINGDTLISYPSGKEDISFSIPSSVKYVENHAFTSTKYLKNINNITSLVYCWSSSVENLNAKEGLDDYKSIDGVLYSNNAYASSLTLMSYPMGRKTKEFTVPEGTGYIYDYAFGQVYNPQESNYHIKKIVFPKSLKDILVAFANVTVDTIVVNSPKTHNSAWYYGLFSTTLIVPYGSKSYYENSELWKECKEIIEMPKPESVSVKIGSAGIATYCSDYDLNFKGLSNIKAYVVIGFNKQTGNIQISRVYDVKAGMGILLIGTPGTYDIQTSTSYSTYVNMLKGVLAGTFIAQKDGDYTNFILANGVNGVEFYKVDADGGNIDAHKAYLQLPTSILSDSVNAKRFRFEIIDSETTGISNIDSNNSAEEKWYNLNGQRVSKASKGVYIHNGKKLIIK